MTFTSVNISCAAAAVNLCLKKTHGCICFLVDHKRLHQAAVVYGSRVANFFRHLMPNPSRFTAKRPQKCQKYSSSEIVHF